VTGQFDALIGAAHRLSQSQFGTGVSHRFFAFMSGTSCGPQNSSFGNARRNGRPDVSRRIGPLAAMSQDLTIGDHRGVAPCEPQDSARPTILVVEDEPLIRMVIADQLREAGYRVIESVNADEAVVVLRSGTKVSVVFSDVQLLGSIDGIALARLVRLEFPAVKMLLTSGRSPALNSNDHDGFFPKPYGAAYLIAYIQKLKGDR
jgi:CheY-like chemotaxis protein